MVWGIDIAEDEFYYQDRLAESAAATFEMASFLRFPRELFQVSRRASILRQLSTISIRLLAFNILLVFLPVAGLLYLDVYEKQLLVEQERAMVQQGRLVAAALSDAPLLDAISAQRLLQRLDRQMDARIRILDLSEKVVADSSLIEPRPSIMIQSSMNPTSKAREGWLYRIGSSVYRLFQRMAHLRPPAPSESGELLYSAERLTGPEIQEALQGRYGAMTRISTGGQRSVTLYCAIPVRSSQAVTGVVLVSQSTYRILQVIYITRLRIFRIFLASLLTAAILSLFVSTTIARPLRRLRAQAAAIIDRRGRITGRFGGSKRWDEIGDLARALEELSRRLEDRMQFVESFAIDVSHEFRNPLASMRASADMLREVETQEERRRFLDIILRETARMDHLLEDVREISHIDARLDKEERKAVNLRELLDAIVSGYQLRQDRNLHIELAKIDGALLVDASPERLAQVFENILDNAAGFSPQGGVVLVALSGQDGYAIVTITDQGPGIPEQHMNRIFERFFTYRPGSSHEKDRHTGLGLAIVRAIVEGYGGSIRAENAVGAGARFMIRLPLTRGGLRHAS